MTDFLVQPDPKVILTNADETELSLLSFHIIIIVEPDPETWMLIPDDNLDDIIDLFNMGLDAELDPESDICLGNESIPTRPSDIPRPQVIWVRYPGDDNFFEEAASLCNVSFNFFDYNDTRNLSFFLEGIKLSHPNWKVAIIGGMFEDDVIRIANLATQIGFSTTVLSRQCISRNVFINLDELASYKSWLDRYQFLGDDEIDDLDSFNE